MEFINEFDEKKRKKNVMIKVVLSILIIQHIAENRLFLKIGSYICKYIRLEILIFPNDDIVNWEKGFKSIFSDF